MWIIWSLPVAAVVDKAQVVVVVQADLDMVPN
jgi:hypothetical protein